MKEERQAWDVPAVLSAVCCKTCIIGNLYRF